MSRKVSTIILSHECEENPCHLNNEEQGRWIQNILPADKLGWNWKIESVKVYDISRSPDDEATRSFLSKALEGQREV